jgi:hypothetical protein
MAFHSWYDVANAGFWRQSRDGYLTNMRGFELVAVWDSDFDWMACGSDVLNGCVGGEKITG